MFLVKNGNAREVPFTTNPALFALVHLLKKNLQSHSLGSEVTAG